MASKLKRLTFTWLLQRFLQKMPSFALLWPHSFLKMSLCTPTGMKNAPNHWLFQWLLTEGLPDVQTEELPDLQIEGLPDLLTEELPDLLTEGLPDLLTEGLPDLQTDGQPDLQIEGLPDLQIEGLPNCQTVELSYVANLNAITHFFPIFNLINSLLLSRCEMSLASFLTHR